MARRRVGLVHWREDELPERAARLRQAGFRVTTLHEEGGAAFRALRERPPDAVVIDLSRLPSHGRSTAVTLRQDRRTRTVPLVFVGGTEPKVADARRVLPDVPHAAWEDVGAAVEAALARPPAAPVVPGRSSPSGTPLPRKLGVRAGATVALVGAPAGFEGELGPLPDGARTRRSLGRSPELVLWFARRAAPLAERIGKVAEGLASGGQLWIAWPKKASGQATDLTREIVREVGLAAGLVDTKVCSIDATWSGLRFSRRKHP